MVELLTPDVYVQEVPAGPRLYDIYDEHLLHHRRYTLEELRDKAGRAGFQCVRATHLGALLYPAFWFVKRRNRKLLSLPPEEKKRLVAQQIRRTSGSALLRLALRLELFAGRRVRYPAGIRCVIVLHKPEN